MEVKFRALKDDMSSCNFVYGQLVYDAVGTPRITEVDSSGQGLTFHTCLKNTEAMFVGFKDKNGNEFYNGSIFKFEKHKKYLLDSFIGQVVWMPEYGCFGYIILEGWNNAFPTAFSEHDELQNDILEHCNIIGSIQEHPKLECVAQHSI